MKRTKLTAIVLTSLMITSVIPFNVNAIRTTNVNTSVESSTNTESTETTAPTTVTEPTTASEQVTTEPTTADVTSKKPTTSAKTKISLNKTSKTLYVKQSFNLKPSIKNGKGKTTYKSSNKKVAKVNSSGKVTAVKKGTAKITVTNNKVKASCKVTVKNPKLNKKKVTLKTTKTKFGVKTYQLKVIGANAKVKWSSSKKSIATVSKKGKITAKKKGTATITAKYRGKKYNCKVTVESVSKLEKEIEFSSVLCKKVSSYTKNIGEPATESEIWDLVECYSKSNLGQFIKKGYSISTLNKYSDKIEKILGEPTFSIKDTKVAKLNGNGIVPVNKGKTTFVAKYDNKSISIPITITKVSETTYKGKKSKAVYSNREAYNTIKETFYNYILKGETPEYESMTCYYDSSKLESFIDKSAKDEYENGENFAYFVGNSEFWNFIDWDETKYGMEIWTFEQTKEEKQESKLLYNTADQILKEINFDEYNSIVQGIFALDIWISRHCKYDLDYHGTSDAKYVIIDHTGVCGNYANATVYLCTLRRIPCVYIDYFPKNGEGHAWNAIKYDGKWYHLDILWNELFLGDSDINNLADHSSNFDNFIGVKINIEKNSLDLGIDRDTLYDLTAHFLKDGVYYQYKVEYTPEFFNKVFGWNGTEQIDIKTLEIEYIDE